MKKLLILGAGIYQVPLIKTSKRLGYFTCVASIKGNYPGFLYADKVFYIDTTDYKKILEICKEEMIDGICTCGTDVAIQSLGFVCENMNLNGLTEKASLNCTNKLLMKKAFKENFVSTAEFYAVHCEEEVKYYFNKIKKPCVLKVINRSGSRGICKIENENQIKNAYKSCINETNLNEMILEEFVDGHEIGVDAFIQDNEILFIFAHDKLTYHYNGISIPIGHIFPYMCTDKLQLKIEKEIKKAIHALNLNNCAVNADVFITKNEEVFIIEMGGRAGATGIVECIGELADVDYYEIIIRNAVGLKNKPLIIKDDKFVASYLLHTDKTGILKSISVPQELYSDISIDYEYGAKVNKMTNGTHRLGQIMITANTIQSLICKINMLKENILIEVEETNEY